MEELSSPIEEADQDHKSEEKCWTKPRNIEEKSREEEFDEYLEDLLL